MYLYTPPHFSSEGPLAYFTTVAAGLHLKHLKQALSGNLTPSDNTNILFSKHNVYHVSIAY